jgi:hypothetical protein
MLEGAVVSCWERGETNFSRLHLAENSGKRMQRPSHEPDLGSRFIINF